MQFTSFSFALFFPIVVLLYYVMPKKARRLWLLIASFYFYMSWNVVYGLLILASILITYVCARLLEKTKQEEVGKRKGILTASILSNLAILVFFKYFYFLYDTLAAILSVAGIKLGPASLSIVLPVGISFYTFQALGYTIDVYRGEVKAETNFIQYALFVSFFPQLVAGPIERSRHLLGQLSRMTKENTWDFEKATRGLLLMLWGYFLKLVIADRAAIFVDFVFKDYYAYYGVTLLVAILLFCLQLYCDFASYSAIAIGAAGVLGIELMQNFAAPFFSRSVGEFWRRWHISLSSWLRDYVYIPLGGNRCSKVRKHWNTLVTFFVSGLWHGASWHYVLWGVLQGIYINIGDWLKPAKEKWTKKYQIKTNSIGYRVGQVLMTDFLLLVSFIFFRANSIRDGVAYLYRMIRHFDIWSLFNGTLSAYSLDQKEWHVLLISLAVLFLVDLYYQKKKLFFDSLVKNQCLVVQYLIVAVLFIMILTFGVYGEGYDATQFIYFQF